MKNLCFTVIWENYNDLDLHVICPCGMEIYYANKKCCSCGAYLEIDIIPKGNEDKNKS